MRATLLSRTDCGRGRGPRMGTCSRRHAGAWVVGGGSRPARFYIRRLYISIRLSGVCLSPIVRISENDSSYYPPPTSRCDGASWRCEGAHTGRPNPLGGDNTWARRRTRLEAVAQYWGDAPRDERHRGMRRASPQTYKFHIRLKRPFRLHAGR